MLIRVGTNAAVNPLDVSNVVSCGGPSPHVRVYLRGGQNWLSVHPMEGETISQVFEKLLHDINAAIAGKPET